MDAQATVGRLDFAPANGPPWPNLARTMTSSLLALLAVAGLLLCVRRAGGALVEPLSAPVLVGLGALLALAAAAFRGARQSHGLNWLAPSAVLLLWGAGLSLHEASRGGLIGLFGLLLVEEGLSWRWLRHNSAAPKDPIALAPRPNATLRESAGSPVALAVLGEADEDLETISQQVVRRRQTDGSETIEGWVRAEFAPGQRHATAHLAICPPLDRVPECFAEQMDGPAAQVKIGQVLSYGVRFEVKLDKPAVEASSVIVEFSIHDPAATE